MADRPAGYSWFDWTAWGWEQLFFSFPGTCTFSSELHLHNCALFFLAPSPRLEFSLVPKLSLASPLTILLHTLLLSERAVWHLIREKDFGPTTTLVLCACRNSSGRRRRRDRRYTPRTRAHRHGGAAARAGGHIAAREGKAPIRLPRSSYPPSPRAGCPCVHAQRELDHRSASPSQVSTWLILNRLVTRRCGVA